MGGNNNRDERYRGYATDRRTVLKASAALGALTAGSDSIGMDGAQALPDQPVAEDGTVAYQYFHAEWTEIEADVPRLADAGIGAIWIQQPARGKLDWDDLSYDGEYGSYDETSPYG